MIATVTNFGFWLFTGMAAFQALGASTWIRVRSPDGKPDVLAIVTSLNAIACAAVATLLRMSM
jgi:hypothetical protein